MAALARLMAALAFAGMLADPAAAATRAHAADPVGDPARFIEHVYSGIAAPQGSPDVWAPGDDIYTPRLAALFALDRRERDHGDTGRVDFFMWVDGNDWDIKDARISVYDGPTPPGRRIVIARIRNFTEPMEMRFYFERVAGRWRLDEVRRIGPRGWTLSTMLKYGDDREIEHGAGF